MKRLTRLWSVLAEELGEQLDVDVKRDCVTVASRVDSEGFSFLAITLPSFASDFEQSLEFGSIQPSHFRAFRKVGVAPAFLRGFTALVFDLKTGLIRSDVSANAVGAVRQLCLLFKKMNEPAPPERERAALDRYLDCDVEVGEAWRNVVVNHSDSLAHLQRVFTDLFWRMLRDLGNEVDSYALVPRHGPGATADRKFGNGKWIMDRWTERLEASNLVPFGHYCVSRPGLMASLMPQLDEPGEELPVKVVTVPKTRTAPRIIAEEPTHMMYVQQALFHSLKKGFSNSRVLGPLMDLSDQNPNKEMARAGSIDGSLATLDLSEASDRVSYRLVEYLIRPISLSAWEAIDAARSTHANVDGTVHRLQKFASMGSALCFPIEEMIFLSIVIAAIQSETDGWRHGIDYSRYHGIVRVYGDDIIVPVAHASVVSSWLATFGLRVNEGKSFSRGNFRESCGGDYFEGVNVTPVRVRRRMPKSRQDVNELVSIVQTARQFHQVGLWKTYEWLILEAERLLGPLPVVPDSSAGLGRRSFVQGVNPSRRWNPKLCDYQVYTWRIRAQSPFSLLDGESALLKCFLGNFSDPRDVEHLIRSGRPRDVKLIRAWVPE